MKRLTIFIISTLLLLFVSDRLIGIGMWWVTQHTNSTMALKTRHLINDTHADIIALGTSRCYHHYDSRMLSDSLGMTVYNGGMDATGNIYSHYILLSLMLRRHQPRYVILDVGADDFLVGADDKVNIIKFAPYYGVDADADEVFRSDPDCLAYSVSHLYRYNNQMLANIFGLFMPAKADTCGYTGYPNHCVHAALDQQTMYTAAEVDSVKLSYVRRFIALCREHGVEPILVVSPHYSAVPSHYYAPLRDLAAARDVPFLDYHTVGLFTDSADREYFHDRLHLTDNGAKAFTAILAHDLKSKYGI